MAKEIFEAMKCNYFIQNIFFHNNGMSQKSIRILSKILLTHPNTQFFEISQNSLNDDDIAELFEIISNLPKFMTTFSLNLQSNNITVIGAKIISESLAKNAPISFLNLRGNQIGDAGIKYIANSLATNTVLKGFDLLRCGFTHDETSVICQALADNTTITEVYIQDVFSLNTIRSLRNCLSNENCSITSLFLWNSQLTDSHFEILASILLYNKSVETLSLTYNNITDKSAFSIAQLIHQNTSIKNLQLGSNELTFKSTGMIGIALIKNTALKKLDLSKNKIGGKGSAIIAAALESNTTLEHLDLRFNGINDSTFIDFCSFKMNVKALRLDGNPLSDRSVNSLSNMIVRSRLTKIELKNCGILSIGCSRLFMYLVDCKTLKSIDLSQNNIGAGMIEISNLLKNNKSIEVMILNACSISDEGVKHISNGLICNNTLTVLSIEENPITCKGLSQLARAMKDNFTIVRLSYSLNGETYDTKKLQSDFNTVLMRNINILNNVLMNDMSRFVVEDVLL
jgi:Ran GTPase-activating protein (RanGAP) involved in mRNA processing and transport